MSSLAPQTPPPGHAPPPYGAPPGGMASEARTPVSSYLMGSMILLLLGSISMLVADFGGGYWNNYYAGVEGWVYIGPFTAAGLIIIPVALLMLYMLYWSAQAMRDSSELTVNKLDRWFKVGLAIGSLYVVLGIIWAGYAMSEEYDDWWLDVGFYGGLIGGYGAAAFFYLARNQAKESGYPEGKEEPLVPGSLTGRQPAPQYPQQQQPFMPQQQQPPMQQQQQPPMQQQQQPPMQQQQQPRRP